MADKKLTIDLDQFKLYLHGGRDMDICLHFDSPSRRFYLTVIALIVNEMKRLNRVEPVSLSAHHEILSLLNETVGATAGSSKKQKLIPRIYKKWKSALPDLENAPLFRIPGKKKSYEDSFEKIYVFNEDLKDAWANLFDYTGSEINVRLRFSVDKLGLELDNVTIVYDEDSTDGDADAWEKFIRDLKLKLKRNDGESNILAPAVHQGGEATKKLSLSISIALGIILLIGAFIVVRNVIRPETQVLQSGSSDKPTAHIPQKASIAVLPFENLSDDKDQEYFSKGMTDELIGDLAKIKNIFVISRNSAFTYKDKSLKAQQIAEELNVRYILEGSVQRSGNKVRIRAQLIDGKTDHHLWSESYDGVMDDIFELQDKITGKIVSALAVKLSSDEQKEISRRGTENHLAYAAFLNGREHYYQFTPDDFIKAVDYFEQAIKIDPDYSRAYATLGMTYDLAWDFGFKAFFKKFRMVGETARLKAIHNLKLAMRNPTYEAYSFAAELARDLRQFKKMINYAEKASAIAPNTVDANLLLGRMFLWSSRPENAIEYCNKAVKLDPNSADTFADAAITIGKAYFHLGQYEQAVEFIEKALAIKPKMRRLYSNELAASYALIGRNDEAKKAMEEWLKFFPSGFYPSLQNIYGWNSNENDEVFDRFAKGLVKAGLPGDPSDYVKLVEENKLAVEEITEKISGHTTSGFTHWGAEYWSRFDQEGNTIWKMKWLGKEYSFKIKSWIEGDMACWPCEGWGGFTNCAYYYRNPGGNAENKNEYLQLDYLGLSTFSIMD